MQHRLRPKVLEKLLILLLTLENSFNLALPHRFSQHALKLIHEVRPGSRAVDLRGPSIVL